MPAAHDDWEFAQDMTLGSAHPRIGPVDGEAEAHVILCRPESDGDRVLSHGSQGDALDDVRGRALLEWGSLGLRVAERGGVHVHFYLLNFKWGVFNTLKFGYLRGYPRELRGSRWSSMMMRTARALSRALIPGPRSRPSRPGIANRPSQAGISSEYR